MGDAVVFDATYLVPLLDARVKGVSDDPRVTYLFATLEKAGAKIIVPTPALSEVLIGAKEAAPAYLDILSRSARFKIVDFGTRAAVEAAAARRQAKQAGDKKEDQCLPRFANYGLALIEAMDNIPLVKTWDTLRGLRLCSEADTMFLLATSIRNHLIARLEPVAAKPAKVKREPVVPASIRRIPIIERNIQRGVALIELRARHRNNADFGRACWKEFNFGGQDASDMMRVARHYASKPEVFRRLSWAALKTLSEAMPEATRLAIEKRIIAGEKISIPKIKAARGWRKTGRPKQALRMAA
jgi:hypothetical protein